MEMMSIKINDLLTEIEHELTCLHGLYACDNTEFKDTFRIDCSILLKKIEKEKASKMNAF